MSVRVARGVLESSRFPVGEHKVTYKRSPATINKEFIIFEYEGDSDIFALSLVVDAIKRSGVEDITLIMNYLPYAQQDRVCNEGESLSIKVFANYINSLGFTKVTCQDAHSDVSLALIDNIYNNPLHFPFIMELKDPYNTILVSPDAGAAKKVQGFAKTSGKFADVIVATKVRNTLTGEITDTVVHTEHVGDKDFLIMDDICVGGYTFIQLAKALKPYTNGKIILYVTHGIFSKGLDVFDGLIDEVYTFHNMSGHTHKLLKGVWV